MSSKGNSRHIKRLAASKYMGIKRKVEKYVAKPRSGRYTLSRCTSLLSLVRDQLGIARTSLEAKRAIKKGSIEVNGKRTNDEKYPVGFGDIIRIVPTDENYLVGINRQGAITLEKTGANTERITKVIGKYVTKGNKLMLKLHDGSVIAADKKAEVNDSVTVSNNKISSVLKFEEGAKCVIFRGKHASETGTIKNSTKSTQQSRARVKVGIKGGEELETLADNVIVTGAAHA